MTLLFRLGPLWQSELILRLSLYLFSFAEYSQRDCSDDMSLSCRSVRRVKRMTTRRGKGQAEEAKWRRGNAELKVTSSKE
jgi:hypothetical protein